MGSANVTVVQAAPTTLLIHPVDPQATAGSDTQFLAALQFGNGATEDVTSLVYWTSSNSSVAEISNANGSEGLARTHAAGQVRIHARLDSQGSFAGLDAETGLTVAAAPVTSLTLTPANPALTVNATQQFALTGTDSLGVNYDLTQDAVWTSSNPTVLTIATDPVTGGLATALREGSATVSARDPVSGLTTQTNATVTAAPPPNPFQVLTPSNFEDITATGTPLFRQYDDDRSVPANIGFTFRYGSLSATNVSVCTNGFVSLTSTSTQFRNLPLPSANAPENMIAVAWLDQAAFQATDNAWCETRGTAPNRRCIIEWRMTTIKNSIQPVSSEYELVLFEAGNCEVRFKQLSPLGLPLGTVGFQNASRQLGFTYLFDGTPAANFIQDNSRVTFDLRVLP